MKMKTIVYPKYQWQGEPVRVEFGLCKVKANKNKPLWWYNYECELNAPALQAILPAVRITMPSEEQFCIANHYGVGVHKLLLGGWPDCAHFSLPLEAFEPSRKKFYQWKDFDEFEYSKHEAKRRQWRKENYPEEFEKVEALRQEFLKYRK